MKFCIKIIFDFANNSDGKYTKCLWVQPHGFFNCSPAVDVPPSSCDLDSKESDAKDNGVAKPISNGLIAKL